MLTNDKYGKYEKYVLVSLTIIILLINIWNIQSYYSIAILDDEFGYWSSAAYFAGRDWSKAISLSAYYSYGYSLLLTPLFWILKNPVNMYRGAIVINVFMLCCNFIISYKLGKRLFKEFDKYIIMIICFSISMYPTFIVYSNTTWAETLLTFICWLLIYNFTYLDKKEPLWRFAFVAFLLFFSYMVHQRTIGMLISGCLLMIIMKFTEKIDWKQIVTFFLCIAVMLFMHKIIKEIVINNVWLGGNSPQTIKSDYAGQFGKIKSIFTFSGIIMTLEVMMGHIFYIGASTYLLCYFGFLELVSNIYSSIKVTFRLNNYIIEKNEHSYSMLFLALSFSTSLIISIVFMNNPTRIDHFMYGRYIEILIGPIMLIGFVKVLDDAYNNKSNFIKLLSVFIVFIGASNTIDIILNYINTENTSFNKICVLGIINFFYNGEYHPLINMLVVLVIFYLFYLSLKIKYKGKLINYLSILFIGTIFFLSGETYIQKDVLPQQENLFKVKNIVDYIDTEQKDLPIYYVVSGNAADDYLKGFIQFYMKDKSLYCVKLVDIDKIQSDHLIITTKENDKIALRNKYTVKYVEGMYTIWGLKDNIHSNKIKNNYVMNVEREDIAYLVDFNGIEGSSGNSFSWSKAESKILLDDLNKDRNYSIRIYHSELPSIIFEKINSLNVKFIYNNEILLEKSLTSANSKQGFFELNISKKLLENNSDNAITIESDTWSPSDYGGADTRKLGIAVTKVEVSEIYE